MGFCRRLCGLLALLLALFVGFWQTTEHPLGIVFRAIFGVYGLGKPPTAAVPSEMLPAARHSGETKLKLKSGAEMPAIGLGMCCRPTAYSPESVYNTILWYLLQGGRHIDTAHIYGNHRDIGRALKAAEAKGVKRQEVFLVTKLWPDDFGYDGTHHAVDKMLQELGVDYLDVVLMHAPRKLAPMLVWHVYMGGSTDEFYNSPCRNQVQCRKNSWKALSELKEQGKIRDLGVSNFQIDHIKELQSLNLAPVAVHQLQYHPWLPDWQQKVVEYCHAHQIAITAYHSLGGLMKKEKALKVDDVERIGKKHSKSTGQVLLRWALEKNVSVIPGTGNPKHMKENLGVYDFKLSASEVAEIDKLRASPVAEEFTFFKF